MLPFEELKTLTFQDILGRPDEEREELSISIRQKSREIEAEILELRVKARIAPLLQCIAELEVRVKALESQQSQ